MAKEVMRRSAADNEYLHKDFHYALSVCVEYVGRLYGAEAVREWLRRFAASWYAPLTADVKARGLIALKEHFERVYAIEEAAIRIEQTEDELTLFVDQCPAVAHIRERGLPVAPLFHETSKSVNEAICEGTPFAAELVEYDERTGRSAQRFYR